MRSVVISGSGVFTPSDTITNEELVRSFNAYVAQFNQDNQKAIESGEVEALKPSSVEFIEKASGIKQRYVYDKKNILDINKMRPIYPVRTDDEPSLQAEMAVEAAKIALKKAGKTGKDIDAVYLSCANIQRSFPAVSIEVQKMLGASGYAYDMNVACSSATFAIQTARNAILCGDIKTALIVGPEIIGGQLNFKDRDSHFIFGEACTALVLESSDTCQSAHAFEILSTKLMTDFSSNIRNNFGFLDERTPEILSSADKYFYQEGRKVFKDIVPLVPEFILSHLKQHELGAGDLKRLWLHQANINMNELISKKILGHQASHLEAPIILDRYANTGSCGSVIAFDHYQEDLQSGDLGVMSSFGAGYSIGSVILKKV